jgi:hypothetical protein
MIYPHGHSFDFGTLAADHALAWWRKDYVDYHGKHDKLTLPYDLVRDGEHRGPYSRRKIDELWLLSSALEGPTVFLRAHNQNCTSVLLPGSKWGPPINDVPLESHEHDTFLLSQDSI